ncbi:MAG: MBL fold metallo-hydrolase [Bacteroidetes bacterium]|nr:MBL fold metallo-hydrolase [Bacteroidota bacterium]
MKITFHGAARTVTGSKHLITLDSGLKILLDCGFFQGHGADTDPMNRHFGFDPATVDILILSHAHIDHSGNIPNLVKQGFSGKIFCTAATHDLAAIMLADTAHIQENDIKYVNKKRAKKDLAPFTPIYNLQDVENAMENFYTVPYRKNYKIEEGVELMFTDSGHILGAAAVNLTITEKGKVSRICFTGDIGRPTDKILKSPEPFPQCDVLICESTYGNRLHDNPEKTEQKLLEIVHETCVEKKSKLIIPAFSLGRTQEVVYALNNLRNAHKLPSIPVYVDSPLSVNATAIMRAHPECFNGEMLKALHNDPDPFGFDSLVYIQKAEDSIKLNADKRPMIIISASGMAEAGRVKHHIKNNIQNPDATILLVGYCTPESLGGRLGSGRKEVFIFGKEYKVNARVELMNSYSAHADYNEMLNYLSCLDPKKVSKTFLVHGDYEVQKDWREKLLSSGLEQIEIPEKGSSWEI